MHKIPEHATEKEPAGNTTANAKEVLLMTQEPEQRTEHQSEEHSEEAPASATESQPVQADTDAPATEMATRRLESEDTAQPAAVVQPEDTAQPAASTAPKDPDQGPRTAPDPRDVVAVTQDKIYHFYEPQLVDAGVGRDQIKGQSMPELERSLERIDEYLAHPLSLGVLKIKASTFGTSAVSTDPQFELGPQPLLLERKRAILKRMRAEREEQGGDTASLQTQIDAVEQQREQASQQQYVELGQLAAALTAARSQFWRSMIERESISTLVIAVLLLLFGLVMVIAMLFSVPISPIISSAFLLLLGYFVGQAVALSLRFGKTAKGE
jgi:hypothetical protein